MPDPVECLLAVLAAAGSSAAAVWAFGRRWRTNEAAVKATGISACTSGIVAGYAVLRLHPSWPPASALDRLLTAVLPAVIGVELLATAPWISARIKTALRFVLAIAMVRVLLHGSVHLALRDGRVDVLLATARLVVGGLAIATFWHLILLLNRRSSNASLPLALALAIASGGAATLLGGYVRGGEAALPLAAALAATGLVSLALKQPDAGEGLIGIGVVGLAGLLIVGHFFGRLTTARAWAIFAAPLMCWIAELPTFRNIRTWQLIALRLLLVAIPVVAVLLLAGQDFRNEMRRLLSWSTFMPSLGASDTFQHSPVALIILPPQ